VFKLVDLASGGTGYSMISRVTLRSFRAATARRIVRIDWTVRPFLSITRPRSSFATRSSKMVVVSARGFGDVDRFGLGDQSFSDRAKQFLHGGYSSLVLRSAAFCDLIEATS